MNKLPELRWRFLAGVSNGDQQQKTPLPTDIRGIYNREPHQAMCSTTPASIYLSQQLQLVMKILQTKTTNSTLKQVYGDVGSYETLMMFLVKSNGNNNF